MAAKIVLLTGGTDGMGRVAAPRLAKAGCFVIVQGRNVERGQSVVDAIEKAGGSATFMACDLASLDDVRRFADEVNAGFDRIDVLINNAGIGTGPGGDDDTRRLESKDGYERRFAVNYLAPYVLTRLLLDKVKTGAPSRIVNVASEGQEPLDFDNMQLEHGYTGYFAYCRSKVALIMLTIDLANELKDAGVVVNSMHPGEYMDTTMVREMNHEVVDSIDDGANYLVDLAIGPEFDKITGRYICMGVDKRAEEQCYDAEARRLLRQYSAKLVGF